MTHTPTPAEIETLRRKAKRHDLDCTRSASEPYCGCGADEALAILDRLSPPAPEVDEATKVWREMEARGKEADGKSMIASEYRRGIWDGSPGSIASIKISYLREFIAGKDAERDRWHERAQDMCARAEKAEVELATLRAENERLRTTLQSIHLRAYPKPDRMLGQCADELMYIDDLARAALKAAQEVKA